MRYSPAMDTSVTFFAKIAKISSRSFVFGMRLLNLIVTDTRERESIGVYYAFVGKLSGKAGE